MSIVCAHTEGTTYDDVHGLVHVDDGAVLVHDGDGADPLLAEHVHDVEYGGLKRGGLHGVERVVGLFRRGPLDVGPDPELPEGQV